MLKPLVVIVSGVAYCHFCICTTLTLMDVFINIANDFKNDHTIIELINTSSSGNSFCAIYDIRNIKHYLNMFRWAAPFVIIALAFECWKKVEERRIANRKSQILRDRRCDDNTGNTQSTFWNCSLPIHDIRKICIGYLGISIESKILTSSEEIDLYSLLTKQFGISTIRTKLLYSATSASSNLQKFQEACYYHPNILILLRNNYGNVIGGYTSVGLSETPSFIFNSQKTELDPSAFLIRIRSNKCDGNHGMPSIYNMRQDCTCSLMTGSHTAFMLIIGFAYFAIGINKSPKIDSGRIYSMKSSLNIGSRAFAGGHSSEDDYICYESSTFKVEQIEVHHIDIFNA